MVLATLLATGCSEEDQAWSLGPGDSVPPFSVEMSDGTTATERDLEGEIGYVVFFSTRCPDCRAELPHVQELWERSGGAYPVILISREEGEESVRDHWKRNGLTMPFSAQEDRRVYSLFASSGIPRTYVCSHGRIVEVKAP